MCTLRTNFLDLIIIDLTTLNAIGLLVVLGIPILTLFLNMGFHTSLPIVEVILSIGELLAYILLVRA